MTGRRRVGRLAAAAAGVASVVLGAGLGELVAGVFLPASGPLAVVGGTLVDAAPSWAKETAIAWFGTNDKTALLVGIGVVLLLAAAGAGLLEAWRAPWGRMLVAGVALVVAVVATTRADATGLAWLPSAVAGAVAVPTLAWLLRAAERFARAPAAVTPARPAPPTAGPLPAVPPPDVTTAAAAATDTAAAPATANDAAPAAAAAAPTQQPHPVGRRRFLALAGGAAALGVLAAISGTMLRAGRQAAVVARSVIRLPKAAVAASAVPAGAELHVYGLAPLVTPNGGFYRVDTAIVPPQLDPATWRLRIHGMVEREVVLTWDELLALPLQESWATLMCVSNPVGGDLIGTASWLGYPVRELLARAQPAAGADMVLSTSVDGFTAGTPLAALTDPQRAALLAIGMNGAPLAPEHGFPARLVVPGLYGYVSATKWVTDLEVTRFDRATGYWTVRGWSDHGPVKLESRIDVPRDGQSLGASDTVVAGVAWHQHTGIRRVEVQLDDGPWRTAELAPAISADTWVQWRMPWAATTGTHTIRCRATSADGQTQTSIQAPPAPDGATGWHSIQVTVT